MIPASTAFSILPLHRECTGLELVSWNTTSVSMQVRRGNSYSHFRKDNWQARRDEIVME